jgi:predicted transcriptional regulator
MSSSSVFTGTTGDNSDDDNNVMGGTVISDAIIASTDGEKVRTKSFKNRNRTEIVRDILLVARKGALKTHVMYRSNLSYAVITQYLDYLMKEGLIEVVLADHGLTTRLYRTTSKGVEYLDVYQDLVTIAGLWGSQRKIQESSPSDIFG